MNFAYDAASDYSHWDAGLWTRVLAASDVRSPLTDRPFTEAMLSGLAGGIGFMIFTFEYKEITTASAVTRFHPGPYVENLVRRCGAPVLIQQTGSAKLAKARLDAALDAGVPAVVRLVRGELPWVAEDQLTDMDSIDVAVVANDSDGYLIDDGGGRLRRVTAAELEQARGFRKADKYWQAHVSALGVDPLDGEALTAEVVRQAIAQTMEAMLSEQAPPGIPAGYAKNFGILGMQSWARRLADTSTKHGWARIFAEPERQAAGMGMLHSLLAGKRYSGPGALRWLYARFLEEAATTEAVSEVGRAGLAEAAAQYRALGEHWDELTATVGAETKPDFATMSERVEAIAELELLAAQTLSKAVS